ncbi:hypothetical protein FF125_06275 [Aureibaculum algae]|uniref:Uncharacterized protein n=1 Tax=Aureibaculum algae TaxID=2584122 RepID=A0A5B7TTR4_9FLAO|nr:hypothetical protein [Aureibaculum algae]QCX38052.1 hypothetical protein FF125_06275 [Aureibaculum algae]
MRKTVFILSFIFSTLIFAQNPESSTLYEKEYYDLINYIPKSLESDSINKPESRLLQTELNTISSIQIYSGFRKDFKLNESDNEWLDNRINQIATALFLDGKRILVSAVGGYSGCPDKMIDTLKLKNIEITNLKFCHTCTDGFRDEKFIELFNDKMYSLMQIEPPNRKTRLFYGKYEGRTKDRFEAKLIIKEDRTFKFWINKGHGSDFTEGFWKNIDDTLILKSRNLNKDDNISFALSSAKWIQFNDLEFRLKKGKLAELNGEKLKLKQKAE